MRIAFIRLLCGLTRAFPLLHLDTLAQLMLPPDLGSLADEAIRWNQHSRICVNWKHPREWDLYRHGLFESHISAAIQQNTPPRGYAIDVGANIGLHTLTLSYAVGEQGCVLALEPNPIVRQRLEQNLRCNSFARNVTVQAHAASGQRGRANLYMHDHTEITGKASLVQVSPDAQQALTVETATLDELVQEAGWPRVDLIKCDIEGHDLAALYGAKQILSQYKPILLVEYEPALWSKAGFSLGDLYTYLNGLGYELWHLPAYRWRGLHRPSPIRLTQTLPLTLNNRKLDILARVRRTDDPASRLAEPLK